MKKSIVALGMVLALSGCAAAADETLAAEPAALVEISPATEETAQPVEAAATAEPAQTATPVPTPEPTQAPTPAPTAEPTAVPTAEPTQAPVEETVAATPAQVSMSYGGDCRRLCCRRGRGGLCRFGCRLRGCCLRRFGGCSSFHRLRSFFGGR